MNIKQIFTSPKLSIQLQELGVPQNGSFKWVGDVLMDYENIDKDSIKYAESYGDTIVRALTSSELGEILPYYIETKERLYFLTFDKLTEENLWGAAYISPDQETGEKHILESAVRKTETNSRAALLKKIINKGHFEIEP